MTTSIALDSGSVAPADAGFGVAAPKPANRPHSLYRVANRQFR
ncbi:MAG: hypothetical protein FD158_3142, partial [bacterium]